MDITYIKCDSNNDFYEDYKTKVVYFTNELIYGKDFIPSEFDWVGDDIGNTIGGSIHSE